MSDCPISYLPDDLVYYYAQEISRRGQTLFDIDTLFLNPLTERHIQLKLPIESILLYYYRTPIADQQPKKLFNHTLEAVNFSALNSDKLGENSEKKFHKERLCFEFNHYSQKLKKNLTILLPKLVLARDLFFSHPYLLRAALFAENYSTDISVDMDDNEAIHIFIAKNKKILKQDLSDPLFLKKLALILLHPDLNRSFLSIYKKTISNQKDSKSFDFDMDAPNINNINLMVSGSYDDNTNNLRVERINTFKNLETQINRPIKFHFCSKNIVKKVKDLQDQPPKERNIASQDKTLLDPKADADIDKTLARLRNITGEIITVEELEISLETTSTEKRAQRKQQQTTENYEGLAGGEGDIEGELPGFTTQAETKIEPKYLKNLEMLLEKFKEKEYEVQEIHNSSFKKFARFKNHLLENEQSDEQPRYFYVYKIGHPVSHEQFYLCEIDNSDSKKIFPPS